MKKLANPLLLFLKFHLKMNRPIQIGIAEDHLLTRKGYIALLKEFEGMNVLFDVANGRELLEALKKELPDIILLDIEMPLQNGKEAFEKIKLKYPTLKVIILSSYFYDSYIIDFIKKGANAFLSKNSTIEKVVEALQSVHEQGYYYDSGVALILAKTISGNSLPPGEDILVTTDLTGREIEIIRLICLSKSNKEIADYLNISIRTVEGHRLNLMKKTNCKTALDLTRFALQNNLVLIS